MYQCGMKQVEEKHVANRVDLMVWSHRLDLLALSNFKGISTTGSYYRICLTDFHRVISLSFCVLAQVHSKTGNFL